MTLDGALLIGYVKETLPQSFLIFSYLFYSKKTKKKENLLNNINFGVKIGLKNFFMVNFLNFRKKKFFFGSKNINQFFFIYYYYFFFFL